MTNTEISRRRAALYAGLGLLIMTMAAIFAEGFVRAQLVAPDDATATYANIQANLGLFRAGLLSYMLVIALDIVVAWALYIFFRPAGKDISLLAAWFRLAYALVFAASVYHLVEVSHTVGVNASGVEQFGDSVMLSLKGFENTWAIGFIFFGLHLTLLGYLAHTSGYVPKIISVLLIIAGLGYLLDYLVKLVGLNFDFEVSMATFIGEVLFMIWLLWKGVKLAEPKL